MSKLRFILFPFALLYALITETRNLFYRIGLLKSAKFDNPIISVGNLSLGGTGKTPHVIYIGELLQKNQFSFAILSRGYGRKTNGYLEVHKNSSVENVGDEPLLFKHAFPDKMIAVCEKRVNGINQFLKIDEPRAIILDDAYQHLSVNPSLNILLTDYEQLFYNDWILPVGNLRELRKNKNRADIIIVTKCPCNLSEKKQEEIRDNINPKFNQSIYFSCVEYRFIKNVYSEINIPVSEIENKNIILITGIAKSHYLKDYLSLKNNISKHFNFNDHHDFSENDITNILRTFREQDSLNPILITTDKDAVKLSKISQLKTLPLFSIKMEVKFLNKEEDFYNEILNHVRKD